MCLTKDDIVKAVTEEIGFPHKQSVELIETLLELMKKTLESGEDVMISGFGKFCVKKKQARKGRNPPTGESIILPPRTVVTFQWSGKLRERLNR